MTINENGLNRELWDLFNSKGFGQEILALENKSNEGYFELVKTHIPEMSFEEFVESSQKIEDYCRRTGQINDETSLDGLLELDQLDEVAGGAFCVGIIVLSVT
ncbi:hypothetical protein FACS1894127_1780 [Clostridia bacterium]|nr:hypothetical protein FACS1894127_1780 [Clostridia bacterium]